eukprot:COSAG05_NODE_156_length_15696_cov_359.955440_2_plen_114_part_00
MLLTQNIATNIKCAGFMENYGLHNNISNNIFASVATNAFSFGADASGLACSASNRPMHRVGALGSGESGLVTEPTHGRFIYEKNIVQPPCLPPLSASSATPEYRYVTVRGQRC